METTWRWILVTAIAPIAWGSTYFVTRYALPADAPLWGAVIRALPAGLVLLLIARRLPRGAWWWRSAVLGTLNIGAFFVLVYLASTLLPAGLASTVMATSAAVILLLAWPLLGQRPRLRAALGALVGFAGVAVMLVPASGSAAPDATAAVNGWGVVASLAAMLLSSTGFLLATRWSRPSTSFTAAPPPPVLASTAWQLLAGGLVVLPVAAIVEGPPPALEPPTVLAFAYVSLIATALAFVAWFAGLRHLPAGTVGLVGLLNPVTGVLLGTLLAAEPFAWPQALGTALVLAGVLLGLRRAAPSAPLRHGASAELPRPDRAREF